MARVAAVVQHHAHGALRTDPKALLAAFTKPQVGHLHSAINEGKGLPSTDGDAVPATDAPG